MEKLEFESLVEPHFKEIRLYCYRILGRMTDAEDVLQETLIRAWRSVHTYRGEGTFRAWLYKIASNTCFDALKQHSNKEIQVPALPEGGDIDPEATGLLPQKLRLEPIPDAWLSVVASNIETMYELRESVTLAFMVAVQLLTPNQRAVLVLRDVLGMSARETADLLDLSLPSVNSLLLRARKSLNGNYEVKSSMRAHKDDSALLNQYMQAWEDGNIPALLSLLTKDIAFTMPPAPVWFKGYPKIKSLFETVLFRPGIPLWKLVPVSANAQPAVGLYVLNPDDGIYMPYAIQVLSLRDGSIMEVTNFLYPSLFPAFDLPEKFPAL